MIQVRNKKVIRQIAKNTYKAQWNRNLLTIFAIILTTFLITSVVGMGVSYWATIEERNLGMSGADYDIALTEPREDQIEKAGELDLVKYAGLMVKCAMVTQGNGQYSSMIRLYYADNTCWEKQCLPAFESLEGRLPEKKNEILLSKEALKKLGIDKPETGMHISLTYYPMTDEGGTDWVLTEDFVLSGYFRDYSGQSRGFISEEFWAETGVTARDYGMGELYLTLDKAFYTQKDMDSLEEALDMKERQILEGGPEIWIDFLKKGAGLTGVLVMILASGYLFIYNTLYLSISKNIRYYGQLKTIGVTSGQLRRIIYLQALWSAMAGIPLGLLAGVGILGGLLPAAMEILVVDAKARLGGGTVGIICLTAALFAVGTVFFSSRKPAVMAGKCSPIEAARYYPGKTKNQGKRENGVRTMAWRNMFRDKKQAFVILASFTVALSLFLAVNILLREYDTKRVLNQIFDCDISVVNNTILEEETELFTPEKIEQVRKIPQVVQVRTAESGEICIPYQEEALGGYYKRLFASRMTPGGDYEETIKSYRENPQAENNLFGSRLVGIDSAMFDKINGELGNLLDREAFLEGEVALIEKSYWCSPDEAVGKEVSFYFPQEDGKEYKVKIGAMCYSPVTFSGGYSPQIIVSQEYVKKIGADLCMEVMEADYEEPLLRKTENQVKAVFEGEERVDFSSKLERYDGMAKIESQIKLLGNSLGVILALLALMNYINMTAAGIQNRSREFAALESLGMTRTQIKRNLIKEGLGYGGISILLSLALGIPLGFLVFQAMNIYGVSFSLPIGKNLVLYLLLLLAAGSIPPLLYRRTQKGSLVERMRRIS